MRAGLALEHANVLGRGDSLLVGYDGAEGLQLVSGRYVFPIEPFVSDLEIYARGGFSDIVAGGLSEENIESDTVTAGSASREAS